MKMDLVARTKHRENKSHTKNKGIIYLEHLKKTRIISMVNIVKQGVMTALLTTEKIWRAFNHQGQMTKET